MSNCGCESGKNLPGQRLLFLGYNSDEVFADWPTDAYPFRPGDLLEVVNCGCRTCGLGIDVRRVSDGVENMVWPEEVVSPER